MVGDATGLATLVQKEDEVLAKRPNEPGGVFRSQLLGQGDRVPVAAKELTAWRSRLDLCQQLVLFGSKHQEPPRVPFILSRGKHRGIVVLSEAKDFSEGTTNG